MIDVGVHLYVCLYMYVTPKNSLNGTLVVDSPFQNTRGRLPVEFIDYVALPLRAPEMLSSLSKSRISLFTAHLALLSQLRSQNPNMVSIII